jgi:deoxyribodipyrimidine photo-lyase
MPSPTARPCIVWFRDDLRLSDHPALRAVSKTGAPVVCLYVLDEQSRALKPSEARPIGAAARWWLAQLLRALQASVAGLGAALVLRKGPAAKVIADLARDIDAETVFWNEIAQAPHLAVADQVTRAARAIAGRSTKAAAGAEEAERRERPCRRPAGRLEAGAQ